MNTTVKEYCDLLVTQFNEIPEIRKALLDEIALYIQNKLENNKPVNLIYVCTHNSRRSHFGQIWAQVASNYYGIKNIHSFSGGTEATAFNPNAINALKRVGFKVDIMKDGLNPVYHVFHDDQAAPSICFSKVYDDAANPQKEFAAIMTCSDAEENCPLITGVELRLGTAYDDPKAFDDMPEQDMKYDERCRQIALETFYVFSKIK